MRHFSLTPVVAFLIAVAPGLSSADFSLALNNVVVSGNLTANNEVEGRTYVGGNLTGGSQYAIHEATTTADTLTVGGNVSGGSITLNTGNFRYGGSTTGENINLNGGATKTSDPSINGIGTSVSNYLTGVSNAFHSMQSTNTTANPTYTIYDNGTPNGNNLSDSNGKLVFNIVAGANGIAVLNINASLFNSGTYSGQGLNYAVVNNGIALKEIVFNVAGVTDNLNINSGFTGNFVSNSAMPQLASETIFNFYEAQTIATTSNFGYFQGALLAPLATYTNGADNQGSVYVKNFVQNSEVHLPSTDNSSNTQGFAGFVPAVTSVPEPATVLSCLTGLGMAGLVALRRRRIIAA